MKITELKVQRFRIPCGISKRMFILDPHEEGEWVSYADYCKVLQAMLDSLNATGPLKDARKSHCGVRVEDDTSGGVRHTYCMKPLGHSGAHE